MRTQAANNRQIDVRLPALHDAQKRIKRETKRFNIMCCGRRFGKNVLLQDMAAWSALAGHPVGWFAPTYKMQVEGWRTVTERLKPVTRTANTTDMRLELITGGVIQFGHWSAPTRTRAQVCQGGHQRAAMVKDLHYTWTAVIRPTLIDLEGDAFFASTPKGLNEFYRIWAGAADNDQWARWHYTSRANPTSRRRRLTPSGPTARPGSTTRD